MNQVYILVWKSEALNPQSIDGFFDRKVMMRYQADNLNTDLTNTIWIIAI